MASIHNFGMEQRGSATSTSNFIRSLGMTLGITIFGMIQRTGFKDQLEEAFKGMSWGMNTKLGDSRAILSESARSQIPPQILDKIIDALSSSIVQTFMWALVPAGLAFMFIFFMGNERMVIKKEQMNKRVKHQSVIEKAPFQLERIFHIYSVRLAFDNFVFFVCK